MTLEERLAMLETRLCALEDEREIANLIVQYGIALDSGAALPLLRSSPKRLSTIPMSSRCGDRPKWPRWSTEHAINPWSDAVGPWTLQTSGDSATATGYSRVYLAEGETIGIYRISLNRWRFERRAEGWRVINRRTRLLGHAEALEVFRTPA